MLSHLDYPDDIKSELEAVISEALDEAHGKAEEAISELENTMEEYREITNQVEEMRSIF